MDTQQTYTGQAGKLEHLMCNFWPTAGNAGWNSSVVAV
jgi:hypothetical protein